MPCYNPLAGFKSKDLNPKTGKHLIFVGSGDRNYPGMEYIPIPCGKCIGCLHERARQWAVRCIHEASLHKENCFITLTYSPQFVALDSSLDKADFQKFMKRLRKRFGSGIRFFHCGEYGKKLDRPHYHACLFNFDFHDKKLWSCRRGVPLYRSKILESLWPFGFSTVGDVTFASAAYIARYCTKKVFGAGADKHYDGKLPEYVTMSRGCKALKTGGIGKGWIDKWSSDVYPHDYVVHEGSKMKPPRFYDNVFVIDNIEQFEIIKKIRVEKAAANPDNSYSRLKVREVVHEARASQLERAYEADCM